MLEMLVAGGGKPFFAKSGPGPKSLQYGNEEAGYFGTLTQAQLFTATEIFNQLAIPAIGPNTDTSMIWAKFYYKGTIVYIPTRPINTSAQLFQWQDLYQRGLVYGTDDDGTYPFPVTSPYNQRTILTKTLENKMAGFRIRLPAASGADPDTGASAQASKLGEMVELLANALAIGIGAGTGKWDSITNANFDTTNFATMKTTVSPGLTGAMFGRGASAGIYNYSTSGKAVSSSLWQWWPVLQYMNPDEVLLDITDITANSPPPQALDLYVEKGETPGGLIAARNIRADLLGRVTASMSTTLLKLVTGVVIKYTAPTPMVTTRYLTPLINPYKTTVGFVGKPPVPTVRQVALTGPYALKTSHAPAPLTGIKLVDQ